MAENHRDPALHMNKSIERNRGQLRRLFGAFRLAAIFLGGEVLSWVVALITHR